MNKFRTIAIYLLFVMLTLQAFDLSAKNRFPKPEFESGHTQPVTITPSPRAILFEYLDVVVLLAGLSLISWFILKKRSRKAVFWMSVFAILYFGFYREGCICSIGAIQNIALALFKSNYNIPLTALLFFVIPIIYTLFFGRTFCAGICPLGALQDIIARPQAVAIHGGELQHGLPRFARNDKVCKRHDASCPIRRSVLQKAGAAGRSRAAAPARTRRVRWRSRCLRSSRRPCRRPRRRARRR